MRKITQFALSALAFSFLLAGCDKTKPYDVEVPEGQVHFVGNATQAYVITTNPPPPFKVTIGTTDVSNVDRDVTFSITSPTGAAAGTEYTLNVTGNTITIPAGQATADLLIQGNYSQFTAGQKDTLVLTLTEPSLKVAGFQNTMKIVMRGPCFDGDISASGNLITVMNGAYTQTIEPGYAPYTSTITGLVQPAAGVTTSTGMIDNIYGSFGPLVVNFDWTDPANVKVSIPLQQTDLNYAAGQPFLVRTSPGQVSTFSVCNQTLNLTYDVIVNNYPAPGSAAYYEQNYKVTMAR